MVRDYASYDWATEGLDPLEELARSGFGIDILPWQKFRYKINSGTFRNKLKFADKVNSDVEEAYLDLGKFNHETLCSLSLASVCAKNLETSSFIQFRLFSKDFYFHAGCFLDSLASLIYSINDDYALTAKDKVDGEDISRRRYMDWGMLAKRNTHQNYANYKTHLTASGPEEIVRIRHALAHSWQPPSRWSNGQLWWPVCMRKKRIFFWPHDQHEVSELNKECPDWEPITTMVTRDLTELIRVFKEVYPILEADFAAFCSRNKVEVVN